MADVRRRWELDGGYLVTPFDGQDMVSEDDVLELWSHEGEIDPLEAERRLSELLLVAISPEGRLVGASTAYLARSERLLAELWHIRMLVAAAHRQRSITASMSRIVGEYFDERYLSGAERRGIGLIYEIESEILKRAINQGVSPAGKFVFIGEDARGRHLRVRYFPGALAPEPE
jgi:hypothetical protein